MYADRVACCPLVSDVEYAPRALLRSERRRDRQTDRETDGRTPNRYITLTAIDAASDVERGECFLVILWKRLTHDVVTHRVVDASFQINSLVWIYVNHQQTAGQ